MKAAIDEKRFDSYVVTRCNATDYSFGTMWKKLARIKKITQDRIYVRIFVQHLNLNDTYNLRALPNRISFKIQHQALDYIDSHYLLFEILFCPKYELDEQIEQSAQSTFQLE